MNQQQTIKMLESLSNANGVSGFEDNVTTLLRGYCQELGSLKEDSLRNLYLHRNGNTAERPVVLLDAHSDEVGFMVHAIKPDGTLRFITIGGWAAHCVPAHRVRVRNNDGEYIIGVIASKPPHFMTEAEKKEPVSVGDMTIDVGASSMEEVIKDLKISIGAPVVPDTVFEYNEKRDIMIGKAFDCRIGCAAVVKTLCDTQSQELSVDIVASFSSQEEVGLRGATVAGNTVKPSAAIVFEGSPADDTSAQPYLIQTALKKGPMLRHYDTKMITNPRFMNYTLKLAQKLNIPVQEGVRTGGATNGGAIHLSNMGVPVIVIGLPVRYIHTHYGIASYCDFDAAVKLGGEIIKNLNEDIIKSF